MARKSAAAVAAKTPRQDRRPDPPNDLSDTQAQIWRETVASEPADFFRTSALRELLKNYCRHTATVVELDAQIRTLPTKATLHPEFGRVVERLLKMRERETKAAADKATKLRLTNQSRYTPQAAATASRKSGAAQPWEFK